jgi:hypothetical protein
LIERIFSIEEFLFLGTRTSLTTETPAGGINHPVLFDVLSYPSVSERQGVGRSSHSTAPFHRKNYDRPKRLCSHIGNHSGYTLGSPEKPLPYMVWVAFLNLVVFSSKVPLPDQPVIASTSLRHPVRAGVFPVAGPFRRSADPLRAFHPMKTTDYLEPS